MKKFEGVFAHNPGIAVFDALVGYFRKLVVFSESTEIASYLKRKLAENGFEKVLSVSAKNRHAMRQTIRENFDADLPHNEHPNDFDIIMRAGFCGVAISAV